MFHFDFQIQTFNVDARTDHADDLTDGVALSEILCQM